MQRGMATWRSMLVTLTSLGLVTGGSLMMSASPAAASGIEVYVGYADTAHGVSPDNFPTPWQGSPNTIYQGCPSATACQFDAGAVRIVNSTGSPVTVNAVAVHVGSCTFSGWPSTPLPAGSELIVTQTAIIAAERGGFMHHVGIICCIAVVCLVSWAVLSRAHVIAARLSLTGLNIPDSDLKRLDLA